MSIYFSMHGWKGQIYADVRISLFFVDRLKNATCQHIKIILPQTPFFKIATLCACKLQHFQYFVINNFLKSSKIEALSFFFLARGKAKICYKSLNFIFMTCGSLEWDFIKFYVFLLISSGCSFFREGRNLELSRWIKNYGSVDGISSSARIQPATVPDAIKSFLMRMNRANAKDINWVF